VVSIKKESGKINRLHNVTLAEALDPAEVLLVVSPTTAITVPMLGLHLLQAG
jgi:hypothetical protein